jgi:Mn-containing catalase
METKHRGGAPRKWVDRPNARQATVLEQLAQLGGERGEIVARKGYMTSAGRHNYDQVIRKIRKTIERGVELGLGHEQMRAQVGVTSSAYYKITGGRTAPES